MAGLLRAVPDNVADAAFRFFFDPSEMDGAGTVTTTGPGRCASFFRTLLGRSGTVDFQGKKRESVNAPRLVPVLL